MMETRVCVKCGKEKPLNEFHKNGKYYRTNCIACKKIYADNYYIENRERILEKQKNDSDRITYRKEYYQKNKEKISEKNHNYWINNKENIQAYREKNKEHIREVSRKYRENNKELIDKLKKEFYEKNKHYHRDYDKRRSEVDDLYIFKKRIRTAIRFSFLRKKFNKPNHTTEILGCDLDTFVNHLLNTYKENYGVEWDGKESVDIDHIIPISTAKTEEDVIELCYYENLQLLKTEDNRDKSDKLDWNLNNKVE